MGGKQREMSYRPALTRSDVKIKNKENIGGSAFVSEEVRPTKLFVYFILLLSRIRKREGAYTPSYGLED